jgi:EpsI family protein
MKLKSTAWILAAMMCGAAIAGAIFKPSHKAEGVITLATAVPKQFGAWTEVTDQGGQMVNPQTEELLNKLYSQLLTRTYVNKDGYRIMLSMAYGDDQRGGLQAHRPEICYPAQGFKVQSLQDGALPTTFGNIEVRRLTTTLGARNEPVTYWLTVGDHVIRNQFDKRMMEFRLSLTGQIPDGLLFRISSIDKDPARAFAMQQQFTADLMSSVPVETRRQLSGLGTPPGAA